MLYPLEQTYFELEEQVRNDTISEHEKKKHIVLSAILGISACDTCEKQGVLYTEENIEVCPTCHGLGEKGHSKALRDAILLGKEDLLGEFWGRNS